MKLKTFYVRAAAAAAAALLFLYPFPAHAADSAALQGQVSAAQREYESAASTLDSMQQQASDTRQQVNDLQSQTDALRGQLGSIVAQLEQSRPELAAAQNQATAAAKALEEKQAAFSARYDSCKQQLTAIPGILSAATATLKCLVPAGGSARSCCSPLYSAAAFHFYKATPHNSRLTA